MPVCPSGHTSRSADYCDVCGTDMTAAPAAPPAPETAQGTAQETGAACPDCGTPRSGRFCEVDGYDFDTGTAFTVELTAEGIAQHRPLVPRQRTASPPVAAGPAALIRADREYFEAVMAELGPDAGDLAFPPYCPERRVPLRGERVRIGRHSASRGLLPEIDLGAPPEDPGVSHLHAVLLARPDGSWNLVDPGSTNGTTLNGAPEPIPVNVPVPVGDGDRIHVGAWTTITLSLQEGTP